MFPVLFCLLYAVCLLYVAGVAALAALRRAARDPGAEAIRTPDALFAGLATLTTAASAISLFRPVDLWAHIGLALATFAAGVLARRRLSAALRGAWERAKATPWPLLALAACAVALGCARASGILLWYDTGLYHLQAVKWIRLYGSVPGLGNLYDRLAFNNAWLVFGALWDVGPLQGQAMHVAGPIAWALGLAMCLHGASNLARGRGERADIVMLGAAAPLYYYRMTLTSVSPDLPAALLILYCAARGLSALEARSASRTGAAELAAVCAFALTVKLSTAPVLLLPLLLAWRRRDVGLPAAAVGLALTVLAPFVARNVVLSGYLFYPVPALDVLRVDWKVPPADALATQLTTKGWCLDGGRPYAEVLARPKSQLLAHWLRQNAREQPLVMLMLAGCLAGGAAVLLTWRRRRADEPAVPAVWGFAMAGFAYWALSAPDFRFGFAWLCLGLLLPGCTRLARGGSRWAFLALAVVCLAPVPALRNTSPSLLRLQPVPVVPLKSMAVSGTTVWLPNGADDRPYDAPLPATTTPAPGIVRRGASLADGFRCVGASRAEAAKPR